MARGSDLVATVPDGHTQVLREVMLRFAILVLTVSFAGSMLWHSCLDADPAHRWLRELMREVCAGG